MHGTGTPPAPDFLRGERQERGEEPQQRVQARCQRCQDGGLLGIARGTVGAVLNELHVVIGEMPEEALGDLQRPGVVVVLERLRGLLDHVGELGQHGPVQGVAEHGEIPGNHGVLGGAQVQYELRGIEQLDREPAADLHLRDLVGGVRAQLGRGRPVPDSVRAVLLQHVGRNDHVALGLGHLLAVRVQDPAGDGRMFPRRGVLQGVGAHRGGEQPGPDDVVALRAHVEGVDLGEKRLVGAPAAHDLRGERGGGPGVQHVGVAGETARHVALGFLVAGGRVRCGVHRELRVGRHDRSCEVRVAVGVQRVPDRHRHTKETLAGDKPVAVQPGDPVLEAGAHERGVEIDLVATGNEPLTAFRVAAAVADVPLAGRHHFEGLVALLEEVHRVHDLLRLTLEEAGGGQEFDHGFLGAEDGLARDRPEAGAAFGGGDPLRGVADDAAVAAHDRAGGQLEFAPPGDVGEVAEGADHGDAGALVRLGKRVGTDLHLDAEERGGDLLAEQRLVPCVVGIRHEGGAGGQQLRAGGLDVDFLAVFGEERVPVVGARDLAVLELGLGHGGAESDVPEGGRLGHVGVAGGEVRQEGALGDGPGLVVDGAVRQVPVHGQAEGLEEVLEDFLVLDGEFLAEFDEVPARDDVEVALVLGGLGGRPVAGVVRGGRIAAHPVVVLYAALGGQAVVVPAHRVEHVLAGHALVARQDIGLGVGEHVADVQRP
ncbi:hypothetical protein BJQ90_03165 [Arthrobacter sp. SO3]|nr:hypothetical protein [Arthrobacter sp. SO3]